MLAYIPAPWILWVMGRVLIVLLAPSYLWLRYSNHRCSIPHLESRLSSSRQLLTSLWSQFGGKEMGKNGEASWLTLILYIRLYPHDFVCKSLFWLVVWNIWIIFPYIGNVIIHWRTPSFFRGIGIPPTSLTHLIDQEFPYPPVGQKVLAPSRSGIAALLCLEDHPTSRFVVATLLPLLMYIHTYIYIYVHIYIHTYNHELQFNSSWLVKPMLATRHWITLVKVNIKHHCCGMLQWYHVVQGLGGRKWRFPPPEGYGGPGWRELGETEGTKNMENHYT